MLLHEDNQIQPPEKSTHQKANMCINTYQFFWHTQRNMLGVLFKRFVGIPIFYQRHTTFQCTKSVSKVLESMVLFRMDFGMCCVILSRNF